MVQHPGGERPGVRGLGERWGPPWQWPRRGHKGPSPGGGRPVPPVWGTGQLPQAVGGSRRPRCCRQPALGLLPAWGPPSPGVEGHWGHHHPHLGALPPLGAAAAVLGAPPLSRGGRQAPWVWAGPGGGGGLARPGWHGWPRCPSPRRGPPPCPPASPPVVPTETSPRGAAPPAAALRPGPWSPRAAPPALAHPPCRHGHARHGRRCVPPGPGPLAGGRRGTGRRGRPGTGRRGPGRPWTGRRGSGRPAGAGRRGSDRP